MLGKLFGFLVIVGFLGDANGHCPGDHWVKLNSKSEVCFESRGDKPGTFKPNVSGCLASVKLVHRSGHVNCQGTAETNSNWGCNRSSPSPDLNTVLTNGDNKRIFPLSGVKWMNGDKKKSGLWYNKSGFNSMSPSLVLERGLNDRYCISRDSTLRVWYGEDLVDYEESNNMGRACVDVYGHFA